MNDHPDLVEDWLRYSEDKRARGGWYFRVLADGKSEVGWIPDGEVLLFDDPVHGCAAFIDRETRSIME